MIESWYTYCGYQDLNCALERSISFGFKKAMMQITTARQIIRVKLITGMVSSESRSRLRRDLFVLVLGYCAVVTIVEGRSGSVCIVAELV